MIRFEMIFVIVAGVFLGTLILNENTTNMSTSETLTVSQLGINANAVANATIDRITSPALAFDEYLLSNAAKPTSADSAAKLPLLTTIMGRETGEVSQSQYDDVDDFNGLDTMVTVNGVGNFRIRCVVRYYDPPTASAVFSPRWFKLVQVTVCDTVPGSTTHYFQFDGQRADLTRRCVVSYFKFLQ
ncbi:MAG: hypothetical protein AB1428_04640 [Bacteroidota bacterium]